MSFSLDPVTNTVLLLQLLLLGEMKVKAKRLLGANLGLHRGISLLEMAGEELQFLSYSSSNFYFTFFMMMHLTVERINDVVMYRITTDLQCIFLLAD